MLLTNEVEIKIRNNDIKYYENLGYEIPKKKSSESYYKRYKKALMYDLSKPITVKVKHLLPNSHVKVQCLCDLCKNEIMDVSYNNYTKEMKTHNGTYCKKCGHILRKETCKSKYGVEHPAQSDLCKEKTKTTLFNRYGVESFSQTNEFKEKRNNTCKTKYGDDCYNQFFEKAFDTFNRRTGYNYPSQSPKVRKKIVDSYYKHNSQRTSFQQTYIYKLYNQNNSYAELNYPISHYSVDICFPKENLCIEYDGGGHNLSVKLGIITQEEFDQKEIVRNNVIKREGYKQMRIISSKDLLPSDEILLQMLEHTKEYFSNYPNHNWIEFNIDSSSIRNAEQKDGIFFNYGDLRRIKESA